MLLLLIVLVMEHWSHCWMPTKGKTQNLAVQLTASDAGYLEHALGRERAANMVKSLALILQFKHHMRWDAVPKQSLKQVEQFVPSFLDQVLRTFNREEGAGNNLIKNHLLLHFCSNVAGLGLGGNFNSGPGEALHKTSVK